MERTHFASTRQGLLRGDAMQGEDLVPSTRILPLAREIPRSELLDEVPFKNGAKNH